MKVLVSAFSSLATDQRIEKVCQTLYNNGYQIELIGNDWGGAAPMQRPYRFTRIQHRATSLKIAYPEFNWKLYQLLKQKADKNTILLANDLDALWPNVLVAKKLQIPLVFDSHEIYTEMPALQGRFTQKIWRWLENKLVPGLPYMMTESESYADWFRQKYQVDPIVIRNIPRKLSAPQQFPVNDPKILLYQGAINQSRGIPQTILAMKELNDVIFKIAGDGPKRNEYENLVRQENLTDKVIFLGKLLPEDLRKVTATADAAISLEENGGVSYLYSLPNKVGDCIQARVPLVLINFPEMKRIYSRFKVGEMTESHEPAEIAAKIRTVLANGRQFYQKALNAAAEEYCWEQDEARLLQLFARVRAENFK